MNTEEPKKNTSSQEGSEKKPPLFSKARQNIGVIAMLGIVVFVILYAIVNISSLSGVISATTSVFTPIILGIAIAYLLNPILKVFERKVFKKLKSKKIVRALSMLMTYVVAVLIMVAFAFLIIPQLVKSIALLELDVYLAATTDQINRLISKFLGNSAAENIIDKQSLLSLVARILSGSSSLLENIGESVIEYGMGLFVGIKNSIIAFFISIYVLLSKERLKAQAKKFTTAMFPQKANERFYKYVYLSHQTFSRYLVGMFIDAFIVGILTLVVLLIFRIPSAILVSTIVACTNVIPVFGPFIGAIPSFLLIFIESPWKALLFLVLILIIQQIDGNIIAPRILGNSTGLSSLGVIISIIIMGHYFGIIGMVLGVPIFSVIVAMIKEFLETKLRAKKLPTDTADYYASDSLVDPHEKHETFLMFITKHIHPSFHSFAVRRHQKKQAKRQAKMDQKTNQDQTKKEEPNDHE